MKHYRALLVSSAAAILLTAGMSASAATLDFEGLSTGTSITNPGPGVTVSASGGIGEAWVYNSETPIGADSDLEGPFTEINGGPLLSMTGNLLIIQTASSGPANDHAGGGDLDFTFDNAVTVLSMDAIDMQPGSTIQLFSDAFFTTQIGLDFVLQDSDTGGPPNKYEHVTFGNVAGVRGLRVSMVGSGAIDNLSYVPLPAAAWLFGSALLGLIAVKRRKA